MPYEQETNLGRVLDSGITPNTNGRRRTQDEAVAAPEKLRVVANPVNNYYKVRDQADYKSLSTLSNALLSSGSNLSQSFMGLAKVKYQEEYEEAKADAFLADMQGKEFNPESKEFRGLSIAAQDGIKDARNAAAGQRIVAEATSTIRSGNLVITDAEGNTVPVEMATNAQVVAAVDALLVPEGSNNNSPAYVQAVAQARNGLISQALGDKSAAVVSAQNASAAEEGSATAIAVINGSPDGAKNFTEGIQAQIVSGIPRAEAYENTVEGALEGINETLSKLSADESLSINSVGIFKTLSDIETSLPEDAPIELKQKVSNARRNAASTLDRIVGDRVDEEDAALKQRLDGMVLNSIYGVTPTREELAEFVANGGELSDLQKQINAADKLTDNAVEDRTKELVGSVKIGKVTDTEQIPGYDNLPDSSKADIEEALEKASDLNNKPGVRDSASLIKTAVSALPTEKIPVAGSVEYHRLQDSLIASGLLKDGEKVPMELLASTYKTERLTAALAYYYDVVGDNKDKPYAEVARMASEAAIQSYVLEQPHDSIEQIKTGTSSATLAPVQDFLRQQRNMTSEESYEYLGYYYDAWNRRGFESADPEDKEFVRSFLMAYEAAHQDRQTKVANDQAVQKTIEGSPDAMVKAPREMSRSLNRVSLPIGNFNYTYGVSPRTP